MFPIKELNPQERHDYILKTFILNKAAAANNRQKRDIDVIRENHKFLWEDEDLPNSWEARLAKKYYDKLFKEYCIADLSRYKENKIALRWRTEQEVVAGTGQFICGNRKCTSKETLRSWEVNFAYMEKGEKKNALIKLRLCPDCSKQLNYHYKKREVKRQKRLEKQYKSNKKTSRRRTSEMCGDEHHNDDAPVGTSKSAAEIDTEMESSPKRNESSAIRPSEEESMNIWKKQEVEVETVEREEEFEKYLEALLM